jgi:hypothetical protein
MSTAGRESREDAHLPSVEPEVQRSTILAAAGFEINEAKGLCPFGLITQLRAWIKEVEALIR